MLNDKDIIDKVNFNFPLGTGSEITFEYCDFTNPDHLTALSELTNHYMSDPMGGAEPLNKIKQLRLVDGLANHPTAEVLFAIIDNQIVALSTCFVNFSTFQVKPYLYIHDIVVMKEYRKKGVGKALMEELIRHAKEREFCKVTLEVREDNKTAQQLYKSLGFAESNPSMYFWTMKII